MGDPWQTTGRMGDGENRELYSLLYFARSPIHPFARSFLIPYASAFGACGISRHWSGSCP
jgi:hypothetical protein